MMGGMPYFTERSEMISEDIEAKKIIILAKPIMSPWSVLGAVRDALLTGPPNSTGGCHSALVYKLGVSPSQYNHPWSTSQITQG
jgi:hypothetical protein